MFSYRLFNPLAITFLTFILLFTLWGCQSLKDQECFREEKVSEHLKFLKAKDQESLETNELGLDLVQKDPKVDYLGKSFAEIKEVLGEPDEQGESSWYGPHNYMLFNHEEGEILFHSPKEKDMEDKLVVSIILGEGLAVLGVEVGMTFAEIEDVLGSPDFGPKPGMENLYYMEYFFGETSNGVPEIFISFSADSINGPTRDAFIKWEAFFEKDM